MSPGQEFILDFRDISAVDLPHVGGKGANLGEMTLARFPVPPGFCVTTAAFRAFLDTAPAIEPLLDRMEALTVGDLKGTRQLGAEVRTLLESQQVPAHIAAALLTAWRVAGEEHSYAVRSSATAEDLPGASFAGQQDTYLNVRGEDALLDRVRACWASLYTDRAILYRAQQGFSHRDVALSVVIQRMVLPQVSGILFTADPISGHRGITSIDAGFGLGEALVSGLVSADLYRIDTARGVLLDKKIADKALAILPLPGGGTEQVDLPPEQRTAPSLTDAQALALAAMGAKVEAHYGCPQDIEWCIDEQEIFLVQTRPITSLFPVPQPAPDDDALHVYFSFGHGQVMTDAIHPMGRSAWQTLLPFGRPRGESGHAPYVTEAGSRLFLDTTPMLQRLPTRKGLLAFLTRIDSLVASAVTSTFDRPRLNAPHVAVSFRAARELLIPLWGGVARTILWGNATTIARTLPVNLEALLSDFDAALAVHPPGPRRLEAARRELADAVFRLFRIMQPVPAGVLAGILLEHVMKGRVPDEQLSAVGRGLQGNVTTEMDLAVGDLADLVRPHAELTEALQQGEIHFDALAALPGGPAFITSLRAFLVLYGMRGGSEVDLARDRWQQDPNAIFKFILGSMTRAPGSHRAHFEQQRQQGEAAAKVLVEAAGRGLWGPLRRPVVARLVHMHRTLMALREHPKYLLVRLLQHVREAALDGGRLLATEGRLDRPEDVWFLSLPQLQQALERDEGPLQDHITRQKALFSRHQAIKPPRVITNDGEILHAKHDTTDLPPGAMVGTAASAGIIVGTARVITDPNTQVLHAGEILVAPFTDPGWTPLFINASALVMEVGGLMTHGSVVAREYGIPAVVCIPDALGRIKTGDQLRVDGNRGIVEILPSPEGETP